MNNFMAKYTSARELKQCGICSRRFTIDRIKTHETICQKSATETRKLFNVTQQRIAGTEFEKTEASGSEGKIKIKGPTALSTDWRRVHDYLMTSIKNSKLADSEQNNCEKVNDLPFSPVLNCNDYVRCPHCLRNYNPAAADRHITQCQKMTPTDVKKKSSVTTTQSNPTEINVEDNLK